MVQEARELEAFFRRNHAEDLAKKAGELAEQAEAVGLLSIKRPSKVELPKGIRTETLTIGTMSKGDIVEAFRQRDIKVTSYGQDLIDRTELSDKPQNIELAWLSGRNLGLTTSSAYRRFCEAGQSQGYNLNRSEVGLYLRLQDSDQPLGDWYWIAMELITDRRGGPSVFVLGRDGDGLWLDGHWAGPAGRWDPEDQLVFSLRKLNLETFNFFAT